MNSEQIIRECAFEIMKIGKGESKKPSEIGEAVASPLGRILECPDLLELGEKRQGNHIENSKYLYYDGQLVITLDEFPKGKRVPPHDHGVWEALGIYRGRISHTVYQRKDDGSKEGYAELEIVDDRLLEDGNTAILAEPADIHSFVSLAASTFSITVVGGHYSPHRHYYNVEQKTCAVRKPNGKSLTAVA